MQQNKTHMQKEKTILRQIWKKDTHFGVNSGRKRMRGTTNNDDKMTNIQKGNQIIKSKFKE